MIIDAETRLVDFLPLSLTTGKPQEGDYEVLVRLKSDQFAEAKTYEVTLEATPP